MQRISWTLYLVGSLLVFGSWMNIVPTGLAWCGWLAALAGWAIGSFNRPQEVTPAQSVSRVDEVAKLELLRKEGVLSDEEFHREKQRILRGP